MSEQTSPSEEQNSKYEMSLSLNVLNHLGLNLYSNVPAVLSETVANAWDADAELVDVNIYPNEEVIIITDDGEGMTRQDVNNRYLHVGYKRREDRGDTSEKYNRPVMGRKGIGKLSLFSVAETVEVYTTKNGDENAFRMVVDDIREAIGEEEKPDSDQTPAGTYTPEPLDDFPPDLDRGTRIVLKDLKKRVHTAEQALRKRLARRFSIIGANENFSVEINGEPVEVTDRDYFHKLEYIWTYGDSKDYSGDNKSYEDYCTDLNEEPFERENTTPDGNNISGWIGTVEVPSDLEENYGSEESDDLNKITLLIRGKMAKENLLGDFNDSRLYTKYLVGEIRADYLDDVNEDDIATSNRQDIVQDDPRYQDLQKFLQEELNNIRRKWSGLRREKGSDKAREEVPVIDQWYQRLDSEAKRDKAKQLFGKINQITTDSEEEKRQLFKFGVMAFERLRYKDNLSKLDNLDPQDLTAVDEMFVDLNDLEATLYYQIVKQRIEAIEELNEAIEENYKEKVLQKHLFNNLWLLDPSWERATDSQYKESSISKEFEGELPDALTDNEKRGRIDIKYRLTTGRHVIIELKRPDRLVDTSELMEQGDKYKRALSKVLKARGREDEAVEVVFVLGREPRDWVNETDEQQKEQALRAMDMRVLDYKELLDNAEDSYKEYLDKQREVGEISDIIDQIETSDLLEE
ncbi:BbrUII/HgiDII family restriction enzyme [Natronosalvus halobius]|uniref:BbrUII/HgiDII family restriction enzyme n=1 Tax=Natronosalvus halobius TaxID=2953746 RepID=UPI00209DD091|nr:ATP-binding protein [Natronosalvus halobius]USZ73227.1 ATP-binding protein [Natronosalvus halobius]